MSKTILSIGSEGGSISLYYNNGYFSGSTNETASLDMLDEEDRKEIMELLAKKPPEPEFKTFREAFEHLHTKYRIFCFIPVYIDPEYFSIVMQLLDEAKNDEQYLNDNNCFDSWENYLGSAEKLTRK
jgi:hypothetical protein